MMSSGAGTSSTSGGHLKPMSHVGEGILGAVNTSGSLRFKSGGAGSPSLRVEPEPDGPFRLLIKAPPPKLPDIAEDMDVLRAIQLRGLSSLCGEGACVALTNTRVQVQPHGGATGGNQGPSGAGGAGPFGRPRGRTHPASVLASG